jgi:hypothetical protein
MPLVSGGYKILDQRNIYGATSGGSNSYINNGGGGSTIPNDGVNTTTIFEAGEDILAGQALSILGDGKVYVADYDSSLTLSCDCIALNEVSSGGDVIVAFQNGSLISNDAFDFIAGRSVYLRSGDVNISDIVPSEDGYYRQVLGKAVTSNSFALNLDNMPSRIKIE